LGNGRYTLTKGYAKHIKIELKANLNIHEKGTWHSISPTTAAQKGP
jgi:hypothetical protein